MPKLQNKTEIHITLDALDVAMLLRVLELDERLHPREASRIAMIMRKSVREAESK